jgi:hypothetical protein
MNVDGIGGRHMKHGRRCTADDLGKETVQVTEVTLERGLVLAVLLHGYITVGMPHRVRQRTLLGKEQTERADELEYGAFHAVPQFTLGDCCRNRMLPHYATHILNLK